ncbi:hypothetical protein NQZ68_029277 [Dissostichus eleginoides]|nr:hypothetical protein NQZ68_029277 [Dissostichus eleginoides]
MSTNSASAEPQKSSKLFLIKFPDVSLQFFVRYFIQDFWETSSSDPLPTFIAVKHVKKFISINRRKICQSIPEEILLLAAHKLKEACLQVTVRCPKQHFL